MKRPVLMTAAALLAASGWTAAQVAPLKVPQPSQAASISQTVGLTEITVSWHRPAVKGREVWGKLVPYGEVWRAGANENTTIRFSTDVTIAGTRVPAGTYGLHVIPSEKEWTFILSRESEAWGSYGYDPADDLLRVKAVPEPAPHEELLAFTFDDVKSDAVLATLRWEKRKASLPIAVDTKAIVAESFRHQLKGPPQFFWQGWNQAASWCIGNDTNLDEAARWIDRSIALNENFTNVSTKARLLEKRGEREKAAALRNAALAKATEAELNQYGYQLLGQGKVDEAVALFERIVKDHPDSWNAHDSLAEAYATKGDKAKAIDLYRKARGMTKSADQQKRIDGELAKLKG